jgi:hypothetical protein
LSLDDNNKNQNIHVDLRVSERGTYNIQFSAKEVIFKAVNMQCERNILKAVTLISTSTSSRRLAWESPPFPRRKACGPMFPTTTALLLCHRFVKKKDTIDNFQSAAPRPSQSRRPRILDPTRGRRFLIVGL